MLDLTSTPARLIAAQTYTPPLPAAEVRRRLDVLSADMHRTLDSALNEGAKVSLLRPALTALDTLRGAL